MVHVCRKQVTLQQRIRSFKQVFLAFEALGQVYIYALFLPVILLFDTIW